MKNYTLQQYIEMSKEFNTYSFLRKIHFLQDNRDSLTLASDGNWWRVKARDEKIEEEMYEAGEFFEIEQEWGSSEMCDLITLLGIGNTDY